MCYPFRKRKYDSKGGERENLGLVVAALCTEGETMGTKGGVEPQTREDYSQALNPNGVCPIGFQKFRGSVTTFLLPFSIFWSVILLSYACPITVILKHVT